MSDKTQHVAPIFKKNGTGFYFWEKLKKTKTTLIINVKLYRNFWLSINLTAPPPTARSAPPPTPKRTNVHTLRCFLPGVTFSLPPNHSSHLRGSPSDSARRRSAHRLHLPFTSAAELQSGDQSGKGARSRVK